MKSFFLAFIALLLTTATLTAQVPSVRLEIIGDFEPASVFVSGSILDVGGSPVTAYGFCWEADPTTPDITHNVLELSNTGQFSGNITTFNPGTLYNVRAFATNTGGTGYSDQTLQFRVVLPTATAPAAGAGTPADPYQVASLANLYWIASNVDNWGGHYIQMNDIDASGTASWFNGTGATVSGWLPVGDNTTAFQGSYDGNGKKITSLFINRPNTDDVGFIKWTRGADISNLQILSANVTGGNQTGIIAGRTVDLSGNSIQNCGVSGSVTGQNHTGGLVGDNTYTLTDNYSRTKVSGANFTGGIAGQTAGGAIQQCYSLNGAGGISGAEDVGGLVGASTTSRIDNCYSRAAVTGNNIVGGLVGSSGSVIFTSYSAGAVSLTEPGSGTASGLIAATTGTVSNSLWDTQTSGQAASAGGTGKTTAEMTDYQTYLNARFDMVSETANGTDDYWDIDQNGLLNGGYPILFFESGADQSLPVSLSSFTAFPGNGVVTLSWVTESELENDAFIIERGPSEDVMQAIAEIAGHGSSSARHSYSYRDETVLNGIGYYYRLSDRDINGNVTRHDPIYVIPTADAIRLLDSGPGIIREFDLSPAWPNPFNPGTNIPFTVPGGSEEYHQTELTIFNHLGQHVRTLFSGVLPAGNYLSGWNGLNENNLPVGSGMYYVILRGNGVQISQKLLLIK